MIAANSKTLTTDANGVISDVNATLNIYGLPQLSSVIQNEKELAATVVGIVDGLKTCDNDSHNTAPGVYTSQLNAIPRSIGDKIIATTFQSISSIAASIYNTCCPCNCNANCCVSNCCVSNCCVSNCCVSNCCVDKWYCGLSHEHT